MTQSGSVRAHCLAGADLGVWQALALARDLRWSTNGRARWCDFL